MFVLLALTQFYIRDGVYTKLVFMNWFSFISRIVFLSRLVFTIRPAFINRQASTRQTTTKQMEFLLKLTLFLFQGLFI